MLPRSRSAPADATRDKVFWLGTTALVLGQLLAFWMVCSHQVRKAEVRHASAQVERIAVADCLQYLPNATLNGCASRVAPLDRRAAAAGGDATAAAQTAVPVNYVAR